MSHLKPRFRVSARRFDATSRLFRRDIEAMLRDSNDQAEIWVIRDFLNGKARELDQKYDFRYSVLVGVFARLMAEGWLTLEDLAGLDLAKRELIRERSAAWRRADT